MVATMLNSIKATLIDHHEAAGIASRVWSIVLQDFAQVGLVMGCVVIGWILVSMVLHVFGAVTAGPQKKYVSKLKGTVIEEMKNAACDAPATSECTHDVECSPPGLQLLEHYGVFGTKPGAWTNGCREARASSQPRTVPHLDLTAANEPSTSEDAPLMPRGVIGARTPRGFSLLEQYGVFGVSPKTWRDASLDHVGGLLTAIT